MIHTPTVNQLLLFAPIPDPENNSIPVSRMSLYITMKTTHMHTNGEDLSKV
jgi:hypothetical protein